MTDPQGLFGNAGGGGSGLQLDELVGKLILIKPTTVEMADQKAEYGGGQKPRMTADVAVFEDDGSYEEHADVFFWQKVLVDAGKRALRPGAKPFILGRVARVPSGIGKKQGFDTPDKIKAGLADWLKKGGKGEKPNFAWGLDDYTPEDVATAMTYVNASAPFAGAE
jgi:hypothetical protein